MKRILPFLLLSLLVYSCRLKVEDLFNPQGVFNNQYVGPIAYAKMTIFDIVDDPRLINKDSLITYVNDDIYDVLDTGVFTIDSLASDKTYGVFDTLDFGEDLFKKLKSGQYFLDNAKLGVQFWNGIGLPIDYTIDRIWTKNANTGAEIELNFSTKNYTIPSATRVPFTPALNDVVYDKSNSNLTSVLENNPRFLYFSGKSKTKVGPGVWTSPQSFLKSKLWLEVPMNIIASNLTFIDSSDLVINLDSTLIGDSISGSGFKLALVEGFVDIKIKNEFPINIDAFIYFLDQNNQVIDSLHSDADGFQIPTAAIDTGGYLLTPGYYSNRATIDPARARNLNRTVRTYYIAKASTFQSNNMRFVKFYSHYLLDIKLVGDLKTVSTIKP